MQGCHATRRGSSPKPLWWPGEGIVDFFSHTVLNHYLRGRFSIVWGRGKLGIPTFKPRRVNHVHLNHNRYSPGEIGLDFPDHDHNKSFAREIPALFRPPVCLSTSSLCEHRWSLSLALRSVQQFLHAEQPFRGGLNMFLLCH